MTGGKDHGRQGQRSAAGGRISELSLVGFTEHCGKKAAGRQ